MAELISAGLLMFYNDNKKLKVFLVHPGGPFFVKKDEGYWGIPKGLPEKNEDLLDAAKRELTEETGISSTGEYIPLDYVIQKGGKKVFAWAFKCENDLPVEIKCNTFELEWPPKSGKINQFPEVDKGGFFTIEEAEKKINPAQLEFIYRLKEYLEKQK